MDRRGHVVDVSGCVSTSHIMVIFVVEGRYGSAKKFGSSSFVFQAFRIASPCLEHSTFTGPNSEQ